MSLEDLQWLNFYWVVIYGVWGLFFVTSIVANGLLIWSYYIARYKTPVVSSSPSQEPEGLWVIPIHTPRTSTPRKDLN